MGSYKWFFKTHGHVYRWEGSEGWTSCIITPHSSQLLNEFDCDGFAALTSSPTVFELRYRYVRSSLSQRESLMTEFRTRIQAVACLALYHRENWLSLVRKWDCKLVLSSLDWGAAICFLRYPPNAPPAWKLQNALVTDHWCCTLFHFYTCWLTLATSYHLCYGK